MPVQLPIGAEDKGHGTAGALTAHREGCPRLQRQREFRALATPSMELALLECDLDGFAPPGFSLILTAILVT